MAILRAALAVFARLWWVFQAIYPPALNPFRWPGRTRKIVLIGIAVLVIGGGLGYKLGRPIYSRHEEHSAISQMRWFLQKGEVAKATFSARRALLMNPANFEACRAMAEISDQSHSPMTLAWRRRMAELQPSLESRLMLASDALRYEAKPFPLATATLAAISEKDQHTVGFNLVASRRALELDDQGQAEIHLMEAIRLEPKNQVHQLELAMVRLSSTNSAIYEQGRTALERLEENPALADQAMRALVTANLKRGDFNAARRYSEILMKNSGAGFGDRLNDLTILRALQSKEIEIALASAQIAASSNEVTIYDLAIWMIGNHQAAPAQRWLQSLPQEIQTRQPVPIAVASTYLEQKDWESLVTFASSSKWGNQDFIRLSFLSHAFRSQGKVDLAQIHLKQALAMMADHDELMTAMLRTFEAWGWNFEVAELLWAYAAKHTADHWALDRLQDYYQRTRNTAGLRRVFSARLLKEPSNAIAGNDVALLDLLLETNLDQAHTLARKVYDGDPTNALFASTFGFSLHVQGKTEEGLLVLRKLKPSDLEIPSIALYYGLLLTQSGDSELATKYLMLGKLAQRMPEEDALLNHAQESTR